MYNNVIILAEKGELLIESINKRENQIDNCIYRYIYLLIDKKKKSRQIGNRFYGI